MAKVPQTTFGKDSKYKLKARMQEVSALPKYSDVDLDDGRHKRTDIGKFLTDHQASKGCSRKTEECLAIRASGVEACTVK